MSRGTKISKEEYVELTNQAFYLYDTKKKGYLTKVELMVFLNELCEQLNYPILNHIQETKIFKLLDSDMNGQIEQAEL